MRKIGLTLLIALLALTFGSLSHSYAQSKVVRITLIDENGSGEDGSAQLTDQGDGTTKVELIMLNGPEGAVQPANIHQGSCASLDPDVAYALNNVTEGKSTTVVKVALATLTSDKHAISVQKSTTEPSIVFSCGNLPTGAAATGGTMTMEQVFTTLADQATELAATIQKKEADAAKNAYDQYHATFAAYEDQIKAKDAGAQAELEEAMHGVNDALTSGDWEAAEKAADELVKTVGDVQKELGLTSGTTSSTSTGSSSSTGGMAAEMDSLKKAAEDLQRETTNKDVPGSKAAYDEFHTLFAAIENEIKVANPEAQEHIEDAMHEVNDAITAGDYTKAAAASTELVNEVNDAIGEMNAATTKNDLPVSGIPTLPLYLGLVTAVALGLLFAGSRLRRTTN